MCQHTSSDELQILDDNLMNDDATSTTKKKDTEGATPLAEDTPTSGTFGKNLTWKIENETLTISGTGELSFVRMTHRPVGWESVKRVIIERGITSIGTYTFSECKSLSSIEIPNSVTSIGAFAFWSCNSLTSIEIPDSVTSIGESALGDAIVSKTLVLHQIVS